MLSHYTVTPLPPTPPTPQSVWRPHQPLPPAQVQPQPLPQYRPPPSSSPHSDLTARPTTAPPTAPSPAQTFLTSTDNGGDLGLTETSDSSGDYETGDYETGDYETGDYETGLWVDVPTQPEPVSSSAEPVRLELEDVREHYVRMGVPRSYLTDQMIWKLMQARGQTEKSFHF